ncbi:MAG: ROK family protein [Acidobacteriota bacterium]|nr:ROK family protein [Acidobacteriota bacterium]
MNDTSSESEKLVGIEVSRKAFKAVCLEAGERLTDEYTIAADDGQETFAQLVNFINDTKNRFGTFERIGVAVPGLVHQETKRIAYSTYIPEHEAIDFLGKMEAATGLKITVENDANAAAYGEFVLGAGRGGRDLFYVTLGAGIGGALIFDGKIWRGASGFAGEFGQVAINSDGMKLEDVASSANIVRRTRSRFHQDSTSSLNQLDEEEIRLKDVVRAAQNDDDFARLMLERTGTYVGTAIASVINLLNIERIVVGGVIMQAEHLVLDAIIKRAKELSFAPSFEATHIVGGEIGANAAAVGVALLSRENEH